MTILKLSPVFKVFYRFFKHKLPFFNTSYIRLKSNLLLVCMPNTENQLINDLFEMNYEGLYLEISFNFCQTFSCTGASH